MSRQNEIMKRTARAFKTPDDLLPGVPLLELYGNCRVLIENHHGVTGYSCCEISVCTDLGTYFINGNQLEIASMTKHRLVVRGAVESVILRCRR